jgi:tRNA1(Val) A37 N6-methylase TrmN6
MEAAIAGDGLEGWSVDAFLGGRVEAVQPRTGHHRSGLDAVLLAAAFDAEARGRCIDLGAGAGVAGFCLAARAFGAEVILAEREAELIAAARAALSRPANAAFAGRVSLAEADLLNEAGRSRAGLLAGSFDLALMNPPFHERASVRASPDPQRARAHVLGEEGLEGWFRAAAALLAPGGQLAAILPAARLADLTDAMAGRFGGLALLPVHPRADAPALRILALGTKGSRAPMQLFPGLILHGAGGNAFTPALSAILREGAALCDVHPWVAPGAAKTKRT